MALALSIVPAVAQDDPAAAGVAADAPKEKSTVTLQTDEEKLSYSVGFQVGRSLKDLPNLNLEVFMQAVQDTLADKLPAISEQDMQEVIMKVMQEVRQQQQKRLQEEGAQREEGNKQWLEENAKKEGVQVTPSGLQYKVLQEGAGAAPAPQDTVTVNYRGTLLNGTEFDSSYKRNEPATFQLDQVIKGWTEGLQLMKEGAKYQFFIPAELGYGSAARPGSPIPPNSVLIFEVELIKVAKAEGGEGAQEIVLPKSQ
ncbi:MAG: FKBP-type peptidyl-prolyl cis-trans isomerase [Candidatus Hydrogenedentes bacterium]|nr:FKBP-type peptidyl-prolyl cis-trans isomerase [Candidatus Hydrogenedentota bacterium]MBI3117736.1 FKBP-type peptidyl-prolyl cis-trans isomerase [Candidatus Hydrogenedentota bacterium]